MTPEDKSLLASTLVSLRPKLAIGGSEVAQILSDNKISGQVVSLDYFWQHPATLDFALLETGDLQAFLKLVGSLRENGVLILQDWHKEDHRLIRNVVCGNPGWEINAIHESGLCKITSKPRLTKLACFSLYGTNKFYTVGAIRNAELMSAIYPSWKMRVYCGVEVDPSVIVRLNELGCEVKYMPHTIDGPLTPASPQGGRTTSKFGMFWKFLAASDPVDYIIFRDTDSRINVREQTAVEEWVASGKNGHIMRDHRNHVIYGWPIMGGMWGIKGGVIKDIYALLKKYVYSGQYCDDTIFLRDAILPLIKDNCLIHCFDQTLCPGTSRFPSHPPYQGFVGQRVDQNEQYYPD